MLLPNGKRGVVVDDRHHIPMSCIKHFQLEGEANETAPEKTGRQQRTRRRVRRLSTPRQTEGVHQHTHTYAGTIWIVILKTARLLSSKHSRQVEEQLLIPVLVKVFSPASRIRTRRPSMACFYLFHGAAGQIHISVCNLNDSQRHVHLNETSWCPCIFHFHFSN